MITVQVFFSTELYACLLPGLLKQTGWLSLDSVTAHNIGVRGGHGGKYVLALGKNELNES